MMKKPLLIFLFFFTNFSFCQTIDSIIPNYIKYRETNPIKAMEFLQEGVKLAEQQNKLKKKAYFLNKMIDLKGITREYDDVKVCFENANKFSLENNLMLEYAISFEKIGGIYFYKGDLDQALFYYSKCAIEYAKIKDGVGVVLTKLNIATINQTKGKFKEAINDMLWAEKYVDTIKYDYIKTSYYGNMSNLYKEFKDYPNAIKYSKKAIFFAKKDKSDAQYWFNSYIRHIELLQFDKKFSEAQKFISIVEGNIKKFKLNRFLVSLNSKKIIQLMEFKKYDEAKILIDETLILAKKYKSSNDELDDINSNLALLENLKGNKKKSIDDLKTLLLTAKNEGRIKDVRDYYKDIYVFYQSNNDYKNAFENQEFYLQYSDTVLGIDKQEMFKDAQVKYQTEKKEKLLILKDIEAKKRNTTILILAFLAGFILLIAFIIYKFQKNKAVQKQREFELQQALLKIENQNKLQQQRLEISRDLHDNIGAQLTFITSSVENIRAGFDIKDVQLETNLSSISNFTKETIVELRDTIWAMNNEEISFEELHIRLMNFIDKAKGITKTSFSVTIDESLNEYKLTSIEGMNVFRTIQEAVNNAIKYSKATNITISATIINQKVVLVIADNGIGFDTKTIEPGNGLVNMKKRIKEVSGDILIDSVLENGTTISITLPFNKFII